MAGEAASAGVLELLLLLHALAARERRTAGIAERGEGQRMAWRVAAKSAAVNERAGNAPPRPLGRYAGRAGCTSRTIAAIHLAQ
jgi:hypothetical protein